jgi:hypothetical protein
MRSPDVYSCLSRHQITLNISCQSLPESFFLISGCSKKYKFSRRCSVTDVHVWMMSNSALSIQTYFHTFQTVSQRLAPNRCRIDAALHRVNFVSFLFVLQQLARGRWF